MTTTDQPAEGGLTRRQLREIRMTGANPIVSDAVTPDAPEAPVEVPAPSVEPEAAAPFTLPDSPFAPRPTAPVEVPEPAATETQEPAAAESAPTAPLRTRRQAREAERVRTGAIPIVADDAERSVFAPPVSAEAPAVEAAPAVEPAQAAEQWAPPANALEDTIPAGEAAPQPVYPVFQQDAVVVPAEAQAQVPPADASDAPVLRPSFGAELLANESFDDLLTRSTTSTGSTGSHNALILSENETMPPLTAPVTSTGQIIMTGTLSLPDTLGSQGHAPGVADGKDVDNVLLDREIPAQSSPTPIAATAAVSQAKQPVEMIRPPAPEKKNTAATTIAIVAGVLALAGVGFIIWAVSTGYFS